MRALARSATANLIWGGEESSAETSSRDRADTLAAPTWEPSESEHRETALAPVLKPNPSATRGTTTHRSPAVVLAEWSGCVERIEAQFFSASLKGIVGEGVQGVSEDAEIPLSDVAESDMELLTLGSFFRLCVFYEFREDDRPRRYTQVVFRRLPAYRASDLADAARRADDVHRALRVE